MSILAGLSGAERVKLVIVAIITGGLCFLGLVGGMVALALFDKDVTSVFAALGAVIVIAIPALGTLIYAKAAQAVTNTNGSATKQMDFQQIQQTKQMDFQQIQQTQLLDALRESQAALSTVVNLNAKKEMV